MPVVSKLHIVRLYNYELHLSNSIQEFRYYVSAWCKQSACMHKKEWTHFSKTRLIWIQAVGPFVCVQLSHISATLSVSRRLWPAFRYSGLRGWMFWLPTGDVDILRWWHHNSHKTKLEHGKVLNRFTYHNHNYVCTNYVKNHIISMTLYSIAGYFRGTKFSWFLRLT